MHTGVTDTNSKVNNSGTTLSDEDFNSARDTLHKLLQGVTKVIRGKEDSIKLVLTALAADGHVLLEDYPGSGKTTLTKTLGALIEKDGQEVDEHILPFRRIQFTPDMLPGDVLGVTIFDTKSAAFRFLHGPVFAHIVLADEINRTGPKVQAAFLECMAEKQVTIDNVTYPLDELFFVVGTQNPLDMAGTYPLPLVQLDRFLLKVPMTYVDAETESEILSDHEIIKEGSLHSQPVCSRTDVLHTRAVRRHIYVSDELRRAIVGVVQATRNNPLLQYGASTRAALMLQETMKAWALLEGRRYCTEDDLKFVAPFVLLHRLRFHASAGKPSDALEELMAPVVEKLIQGNS